MSRTQRWTPGLSAAAISACLATACVPGASSIQKDATSPADLGLDAGLNPADAASEDGAAGDVGNSDLGPADTGVIDTGPLPDRDGDGLPDEADPQPDTPNGVLLDEPFDDLSNGWIFSSVSMRIDAQSSLLTVDNLEALEREGWVGPKPTWGDYIVRARTRVRAVGNDNDSRSGHVGVIVRVQQVTPSRYLTCGVDLRSQEILLAEHEGNSRTTLASMSTGLALDEWFEIRFTARGRNLSCGVAGQPILTAESTSFTSGSVGFRTYDSTFEADWLVVHDLPP